MRRPQPDKMASGPGGYPGLIVFLTASGSRQLDCAHLVTMAMGSGAGPILHVPEEWCWVVTFSSNALSREKEQCVGNRSSSHPWRTCIPERFANMIRHDQADASQRAEQTCLIHGIILTSGRCLHPYTRSLKRLLCPLRTLHSVLACPPDPLRHPLYR